MSPQWFQNKKWAGILFLILLLALTLRLYQLDRENLWTDEAFTIHHAQEQNWGEFIHLISTTEGAPPGHYLFLHYWINGFGNSEFLVRLPSVIFGVLSVGLLFLIVREIFDEKTALLSSLFMSTSMLQVLFAQEARLYSLFTFLVLLSAYFFLGVVREKKQYLYFLYLLSITLAFLINYLTLMVILLYGAILWLKRNDLSPGFLRRWIVHHLLLAVGVGFLVWPILKTQFSILNEGLQEILVSKGIPSFLASLGLFFYVLPIFLLTLGLLLLLWIKPFVLRLLQHRWFDALFSLLVIIAGSSFIYASLFPLTLLNVAVTRFPITHSYFLIRHSFFLVPLWYVFLGWKIAHLPWRRLAAVLTILIVMVSSIALYEYYTQTTKAEWQEATAFIAGQSVGTAPLILLDKGSLANTFLLDYYYRGDYRLVKLTVADRPRDFRPRSEAEVISSVKGEKELWLILARNARTGNYYRDFLDQQYERHLHKEWYQIEVYRYRQRSAPAPPLIDISSSEKLK